MASSDLEQRWPVWPPNEEGKELLDVVLDCSVDSAFLMLYGGLTELRKAFNEIASNKEYSTTAWMDSAEAVQAAAVGPTPPPLRDTAGLKAGMLRRASYSGTMMGSKYRNEELYRLQEISPGTSYRILTTVLTTAMHGEKFRPVVLSSLTALPEGRTQYKIRSVVRFITKPNGFIKAMIDKGARDGQRKNFEALRQVLEQYTTVTEAAEALGAAVAAAAAPEAPVAAPAAGEAPAAAAAGLLEAVAGPAACRHLAPWAVLLHARLAAAAPVLGDVVEARVLLGSLAALCLLTALRLVVDMLLFIHHASAHPKDTIGLLTHYLFKVVDVPDSMQEVLLSCLIFYTVRLLVNRLAEMLPAPPAARRPPPRAPRTLSSANGDAGSGALGGAAGSPRSLLGGLRSEEVEAEGIKYEGYAEAIAAAQARSPSASGAATPERVSMAGAVGSAAAVGAAVGAAGTAGGRQQGGSFMKGFTKSISGAFTPSRTKKVIMAPEERVSAAAAIAGAAAAAGAVAAAASGAASGAASPAAGAAALAGGMAAPGSVASRLSALREVEADSGLAAAHGAAGAGGSSAPGSPPSVGAISPSATSPTAQSALAVPRSLSESAAAIGSVLPAGLPAALAGSASSQRGMLPGDLPPGSALSPQRSLSPARAGGGMAHSRSQGGLAEQSGSSVTAFAKKLRGVLSPTGQPGSPGERKSMDGGSEPAALSPDQMLSPTAAQRDFRPSMPAHLPPELAGQAVIEEVFENQRLQPFRGWGHTWPGHFLPTDKVNHWSRREHDNFPVLAGPDFGSIAPPLPEGWQWCEAKWHLDLSGQIIDACDPDGWSYGLDFGYVRHPFQPNSGKKKISDFVRRRRWIRTRVPLELAAQRRTTTISEDNTSWAKAVGGGEEAEGMAGEGAQAAEDGAQAIEDAREVHAVVESMFAQVVARSEVEASMQEALSQQIGSRSSSGSGSNIRSLGSQGSQAQAQPAAGLQAPAAQPAAHELEQEREREQAGEGAGAGGVEVQSALPAAAAGAAADEAGEQAAADETQQLARRGFHEASVSFTLPASSPPPPVEPRSAAAAAAAALAASGLTFSSGAVGDDLLVSPTEQLRGFERSSSHGVQQGLAQAACEAAEAADEVRQHHSSSTMQPGPLERQEDVGSLAAELNQAGSTEEASLAASPVDQPPAPTGAGAGHGASGGDLVAPLDDGELAAGGDEGAEGAEGGATARAVGEPAELAEEHSGVEGAPAEVRSRQSAGQPAEGVGDAAAKPALTQVQAEAEEHLDGSASELSNGEESAARPASDALHLVAHR